MLNKDEKRIIIVFIIPILDKMSDYYIDFSLEDKSWNDIRDIIKKDIKEIEKALNSILTEKFVKYSSAGILRRYGG